MGISSGRLLSFTIATVLVVSCGTSASIERSASYLDDSTGATVTRVERPFTLFSDDPGRAANARDYMDAAPLAVNQSGKRSWWLWLGLWSTIDRGVSVGEAQLADLVGIQLLVDGEPMELDMAAVADRVPGVTSLPYRAPVATARTLVFPLTASQVTRLGNGTNILVRTELAGGAALLWQPWVGGTSWNPFADIAATVPGGT